MIEAFNLVPSWVWGLVMVVGLMLDGIALWLIWMWIKGR